MCHSSVGELLRQRYIDTSFVVRFAEGWRHSSGQIDKGLRVGMPLLDRNVLVKLSHACLQLSSPELNSLLFDHVENVPHHSGTDMIDPTLHTVFAKCSSTPGAETVAERVMSLVERTDCEEIQS